MADSRYTLGIYADSVRLNVERVEYTEPNAIAPLTGSFELIDATLSGVDVGGDLLLMLEEDGLATGTVAYVYAKNIETITDETSHKRFVVDFECDIGYVMEQVIAFGDTYFDAESGVSPATIASPLCSSYYTFDLSPVEAVESGIVVRDFQFQGKRYDALLKFERAIGGKAYIHRDEQEIVFVPTYHDSTLSTVAVGDLAITPLHENKSVILNNGVYIVGSTNTVSQTITSNKAYRLGSDSWAVFINREAQGGNSETLKGWLRATITHPDIRNSATPLSDGISNVQLDGSPASIAVYSEDDLSSIAEEPEEDFMAVLDAISIDFYRRVNDTVSMPAGAWSDAIAARKAKQLKNCTVSFDVYGNKFAQQFTVSAGAEPYEIYETHDCATVDAAQRVADIISDGMNFQFKTRMQLDAGVIFRPGQLVTYDGGTYIIDEVSCTSHPYHIELTLLKWVT